MTYYPPASFHFQVKFSGVETAEDASFSEVSGLDAERPALEVREGGENRFAHKLPERARYGNLVLKRGLLVWDSELAGWCGDILESDLGRPIAPRDLVVSLLDQGGQPLMVWSVNRAWPVKWSVAALAADKSEIAVETLELAYSHFTRRSQPQSRKYLKP